MYTESIIHNIFRTNLLTLKHHQQNVFDSLVKYLSNEEKKNPQTTVSAAYL